MDTKTTEGTDRKGMYGLNTKYSKNLSKYFSIFPVEIHATEKGIQSNFDINYRRQNIIILSDNQATIKVP